ncbi:Pycsar system effector family protein [Stenotrophomonas sp.]|uniref:Pycsar system effector family protein n=1 Tax=Stenotrophomonas sp. TaxID=69392 RepID=UPI002D44D192|nr:Pycsar system effector family protein [Stenotrophomonas sp.]HYQ23981.1 Pycsar system effector family protein [Stenotrophomonas sp.]
MESSQRAWTHLQVILSFFPRVDAMLAVLLGVNTAMAGVLFSKWPGAAGADGWIVITTICFALFSALCYLAIYRAAFPNLEPAGKSTIFFGDVAKLSAPEYSRLLLDVSDRELALEIAHQVWRNSSILMIKYGFLRNAFGWLLASIAPWVVSLLSISVAR